MVIVSLDSISKLNKGYRKGEIMSEALQPITDQIETELSKKLFHLKTLYDVSRELIGMDSIEAIMHRFLLMSTGNFGVFEGFMQLYDRQDGVAGKLESVGIHDSKRTLLEQASGRLLAKDTYHVEGLIKNIEARDKSLLPDFIEQVLIFKVSDTSTGILGLGAKIVEDPFSKEDLHLLETLVNNLIAALKNAMATEALRDAYHEVSSLNRAKDKVINHLSHELKTPIALLGGSLALLKRALTPVPAKKWERTIQRAGRSLERLSDLQQEVEDIMQIESYESHSMICRLLDECCDELESLAVQQVGQESVAECIRERINDIFGLKKNLPEEIVLNDFVTEIVNAMKSGFSHRMLDVKLRMQPVPKITIPGEALTKVIEGLIKNAVENTPDEGKITINVAPTGNGVALKVQDFGVGILPDHQVRIFEGFYPTQETDAYASKQPFDFNAGGKGADLLRMKIFSERYGFKLDFFSERCRHIPGPADVCPGSIHACPFCSTPEDCFDSGGSNFRVIFSAI